MAVVHDAPTERNWAARLLTTDFCPWANRFVYWLKEPVGWFAMATVASIMVGLYLAPIGWTLAALLIAVIAIGMVWPAIAVRIVSCSLTSADPQVHEDDACQLQLSVKNHLPLPVWGLAVEGFLDRSCEADTATNIPTVALAFVRGLATSTYTFSMRPSLRGRYPSGNTLLTCSFPFGIWTAKRKLRDVSPVTVWPKVFPINGQTAMTGRRTIDLGEGNRSGRTGDFLGLRDYRQGDSLRQINWIATARSGDLVVTDRSGPQCPLVDVFLDTSNHTYDRKVLDDRIRVAASILANLQQTGIPLRVQIGKQKIDVRRGWDGFVQTMDTLTDIPAEGGSHLQPQVPARGTATLIISSNACGDITVCLNDPNVNRRSLGGHSHRILHREQDLARQILSFWLEGRDANLVA